MKFIKKWINQFDELQPEPSGMEPVLNPVEGIRAVFFDIYGTLLVSASGDIDQATISTENLRTSLKESNYILLKDGSEDSEAVLKYLLEHFVSIIRRQHHIHKNAGRQYPEVDIRQVWDELITFGEKKKIIKKTDDCDPDRLTFIFELLSNRVNPMPGMKDIILYLHGKKYPLGIVSNAQYYTPVVMNYYLTGKEEEKENIEYFDPDLTVMSYTLLKSKPDLSLFRPVTESLMEKYGIRPQEAVFVGNDMFKDLYPASQLGMKTILFAGDKRSLRLRHDKKEVNPLKPDAVITALEQLKQILGI
ncbi:MAG: HAD family hydrolase [Bacteroidales bacterium]